MDEVDRATELEALHRTMSLQKQSVRSATNTVSLEICIDCEMAIPLKRQLLGGVERCIECATFYEKQKRQRGYLT